MRTETARQLAGLRKELGQPMRMLLKAQQEDGETRRMDQVEQKRLLEDIRSFLSRIKSMTASMSRENRLLRRLYFESMNRREDNITNAEKRTFKWILEDKSDCATSVQGQKDKEEQEMRQRTRQSFLT